MVSKHRYMPDMTLERSAGTRVAGLDEAGRSPVAGPVVAAAVILPEGTDGDPRLAGLTDSKQLDAPTRETLFGAIMDIGEVGIGAAAAWEVDRMNIMRASMLAMRRAVVKLRQIPDAALVDGNRDPGLPCETHLVVHGDRLSLSIAAASVVAKVTRDRVMVKLAPRHPGFGWASNKGYASDEHIVGLLVRKPTAHHRKTFVPLSSGLCEARRILKFGAVDATAEALGSVRLLPVRTDIFVLADSEGRFLGLVKWMSGRRWVVRATLVEADGSVRFGAGPLESCHNLTIEEPAEAMVQAALCARREEAGSAVRH